MSFNPNIIVFGVGGAGCNAVNNMIDKKLSGVKFIAANTDMQTLAHSKADTKIQLGVNLTRGLGAGGDPEVGRESVRENMAEIKSLLTNCNMLFITAGMGGGTGTGAAPLIAKLAREMNILTIGIITKPFTFEGRKKMELAMDGINAMKSLVGTLIIVPNQNLMRLANEKTTSREAFLLADEVLYSGVAGISDIIVKPGHINLDLADLRGVMAEMGRAVLGTGEAEGEDRAVIAAENAIKNPMLENTNIHGAKQILINIAGGEDLTLFETERAIDVIIREAGDNSNIHIGSSSDESMNGRIRVSVVATGISPEKESRFNITRPFGGDQPKDMAFETIKNSHLNPLRPKEEKSAFLPDAVPHGDDGQGEHLPLAARTSAAVEQPINQSTNMATPTANGWDNQLNEQQQWDDQEKLGKHDDWADTPAWQRQPLTDDVATKKKPSLFKKITAAFFGADEPDDSHGEEILPQLVDRRNRQQRAELDSNISPRKQSDGDDQATARRGNSKKKYTKEEQDLFSIPSIE
ncbi:MAG: cell division protein FtsZ [Alphaproteobacteria bacterium]|nr:cell division protein FtsZ [Alphaproteobacteria bacterium]